MTTCVKGKSAVAGVSRRAGRVILAVACSMSYAVLPAMEIIDDPATTGAVTIKDGAANVLTYRYGDQLPDGVDIRYTRSSYIHPLWAPDGSVLTDDFPKDHYHHHGIFWGWPVVKTRDVTSDNWMYGDPSLRHHFVRWLRKESTSDTATLSAENRWLLDGSETVAREEVTLKAHAVKNGARAIDVEITIEAVGGPLSLQGSPVEKKGYGGFSYRGDPAFKGGRILTDDGVRPQDIMMERHKWLAISEKKNGLAIFVAKDHPDYPPYGFGRQSYTGYLNISWPGLEPVTLQPGAPVKLAYRLYTYPADMSDADIHKAYEEFVAP